MLVGDVVGHGFGGCCFGTMLPFTRCLDTLLDLADRRDILIKTRSVIAAKTSAELTSVIKQRVENATSLVQAMEFPCDGRLIALHKHLAEQCRRAVFGRQ